MHAFAHFGDWIENVSTSDLNDWITPAFHKIKLYTVLSAHNPSEAPIAKPGSVSDSDAAAVAGPRLLPTRGWSQSSLCSQPPILIHTDSPDCVANASQLPRAENASHQLPCKSCRQHMKYHVVILVFWFLQ